ALHNSLREEADRLETACRRADAECERKAAELQQSVESYTNRVNEALRGAGQASDRLEHLSAKLETLERQSLSSFQSQADDLLSRYADKLHQRSETILKDFDSRMHMPNRAMHLNPTMVFVIVAGLIVALAAVLGAYHREVGRELARLGQTME